MLTVKNLKLMLRGYPDDMRVVTEQGRDIKHVGNCGAILVISPDKPIGFCARTGENVFPSEVAGYSAYSPTLDEDLYDMEWEPFKRETSDEKDD